MTDTWHVEAEALDGYLHDRVDLAVAASVESHLLACSACRATLAARTPAVDVDRSWSAIERRIDEAIPDPMVRAGRALGLPEIELRLLAPTGSLRSATLLAILIALTVATLLTHQDSGGAVSISRLAFLVVAPLVPLIAVVAAVGTGSEPSAELARSAPYPRLRIAALRASVALAAAVAAGVLLAVTGDGPWTRVGLWLLPALAISSIGAVGARFAPAQVVVATLGGTWLVVVAAAARATDDRLAAFRPGPQIAYLVIAVGVAALIALRPSLVELRESP